MILHYGEDKIIDIMKNILSWKGLAFTGENQIIGDKHNGNYLGWIELLAKFDPIKHLFCK